MEPILDKEILQKNIDRYALKNIYLHLETTNGAYASHHNEKFFSASAYIRNAEIKYEHGKITGSGPYRIGLKLEKLGWVYAEGLTHFEANDNQLLLAGHGSDGKLGVALQLSQTPFQ
ncbi:YojF family protein [Alkalihalobacillus trypoxylicola]|uniref:DUF1806 domain-containing protein n=1 Tax=Alkalihalobacillus trypoxylicola TaxID=519424 RepID=A0A162F5K0_9BACI|nr:YojF family protein [Alkalihalobacillus trypoxylicola]KYG34838.1 hypothetical protein AZF04_00445 [Alkalihalobacillus trypoxylicola]